MHEAQRNVFDRALAVINRALDAGAKPGDLFAGIGDDEELVIKVRGANPDEDDVVSLRLHGGTLEPIETRAPREPTPERSFTIRLDDLARIGAEPSRFAGDKDALASLIAAFPG